MWEGGWQFPRIWSCVEWRTCGCTRHSPRARSPVTHLDPTPPHHRSPVGANHAKCAPQFQQKLLVIGIVWASCVTLLQKSLPHHRIYMYNYNDNDAYNYYMSTATAAAIATVIRICLIIYLYVYIYIDKYTYKYKCTYMYACVYR